MNRHRSRTTCVQWMDFWMCCGVIIFRYFLVPNDQIAVVTLIFLWSSILQAWVIRPQYFCSYHVQSPVRVKVTSYIWNQEFKRPSSSIPQKILENKYTTRWCHHMIWFFCPRKQCKQCTIWSCYMWLLSSFYDVLLWPLPSCLDLIYRMCSSYEFKKTAKLIFQGEAMTLILITEECS